MAPTAWVVPFAFRLVVATCLCCFCFFPAPTAAVPPVITFCSHPITYIMSCNLQARYSLKYYASQYTNFQWKYKFIGGPTLSIRSFIAAWSINGSGCDVLLGPGFSSLAAALSPTVDKPWLDWSATSTELSDPVNFPTFSRVAPTDDFGAKLLVNAVSTFGWKQISIFCVDGPYGRSVTSGLSNAVSSIGGVVEASRCLPSNAPNESIREIIDSYLLTQSKLLAIAMTPSDGVYSTFVAMIHERKLEKEFIFLFAEGFCSSSIASYLEFAGSFCVTYNVDPVLKEPFLQAFVTRSTVEERAELQGQGFDVDAIDFNGDDVFASFAHDAAVHMMSTINSYTANLNKTVLQHLRSLSTAGFTGDVKLNAKGDRAAATAVLYNVVNGQQVAVGLQTNILTPTALGLSQGVFVDGGFRAMNAVPSSFRAKVTSTEATVSVNLLIGVCLLVLAFIAVVLLVNKLRKSKRFKALIASGAILLVVLVFLHLGFVVLKVFAAMSVATFDSGKWVQSPLVIVYLVVSALTAVSTVLQVAVLLRYLWLNMRTANELPEDTVMLWEMRIDQSNLVSLALQDIPLSAVTFAALLQQSVTVPVLLCLCISTIFAGTKMITLKGRIGRWMNEPPLAAERRFRHLRDVAKHVALAQRLSGARGFVFTSQEGALNHRSTPNEICAFQKSYAAREQRRFEFTKRLARHTSRDLKEAGIVAEEFFGVIRPMFIAHYDHTEGGSADVTDMVMGMSIRSPAAAKKQPSDSANVEAKTPSPPPAAVRRFSRPPNPLTSTQLADTTGARRVTVISDVDEFDM